MSPRYLHYLCAASIGLLTIGGASSNPLPLCSLSEPIPTSGFCQVTFRDSASDFRWEFRWNGLPLQTEANGSANVVFQPTRLAEDSKEWALNPITIGRDDMFVSVVGRTDAMNLVHTTFFNFDAQHIVVADLEDASRFGEQFTAQLTERHKGELTNPTAPALHMDDFPDTETARQVRGVAMMHKPHFDNYQILYTRPSLVNPTMEGAIFFEFTGKHQSTAIPEPDTLMLVVSGLSVFLVARRRTAARSQLT